MEPVRLTREVDGFIANRLQAVLLWEAFRLLEGGYASAKDIDMVISAGLGRRWSFIGPFETIDLNSPAGVRGYCAMLGDLYFQLAEEQADPRRWSAELVSEIERQRRTVLAAGEIPARQSWRDRRLAKLVRHRREAEGGDG